MKGKDQRLTVQILRESAGITQQELAHRLHCGVRIVGHWDKGEKLPRIDNALALARELRVSLKTLFEAFGLDTTDIPDDTPST